MNIKDLKIIKPFDGSFPITQGYHSKHLGVDWAMPESTPIIAVDYACVLKTGFQKGGYGNYVILRHKWGTSAYAHLSEILVSEGEFVAIGGMVGKSGNTGNVIGEHGGYHLHFESINIIAGQPIAFDPRPIFKPREEAAFIKCPHCGNKILL